MVVNADWIGEGDASKYFYMSRSQSGNYVWKSSDSSKYRDASATCNINGCELE